MFLQIGLGGGRIFVRFLAHTLNLSSPAKAKARPEADNKKTLRQPMELPEKWHQSFQWNLPAFHFSH